VSRAWLALPVVFVALWPAAAAAQPAPPPEIHCLTIDAAHQLRLEPIPAGTQPKADQVCYRVDAEGHLLRITPPAASTEPDLEAVDSTFTLAPGVDVDSGASLSMVVKKGWGIGNTPSNWVRYVAFDAKGEGTTSTEGSDHAETSLVGEYFCCARPGRWDGGGLVSLQGKWGELASGEGSAAEVHSGNQLLGRLGLSARWSGNGTEARTAVTRNWVLDSSGDLPLPKDLDKDHWQWTLDFSAGPKAAGGLGYVELTGGGRVSWTDDWDPYGYLALVLRRELEGKTALTVRFESGKDPGFDYDQKLVLGILLDLLRSGSN